MSTRSDQMSRLKRVYFVVIGIVLTFVVISWGISTLNLPTMTRICIALAIAIFQVTLSAAYFMHLNGEKKLIYVFLILTGIFFALLLLLPALAQEDHTGTRLDTVAPQLQIGHHGEDASAHH